MKSQIVALVVCMAIATALVSANLVFPQNSLVRLGYELILDTQNKSLGIGKVPNATVSVSDDYTTVFRVAPLLENTNLTTADCLQQRVGTTYVWNCSGTNLTFASTGIGFNTSTPSSTVHSTGEFAVLDQGNTELFIDRLSGNVGIGTATPGEALSVVGRINASGTVNSNAGLDFAEAFSADGPLTPGTVVRSTGPHSVSIATNADGGNIIGVVTTDPGFTVGLPGLENRTYIAIAGRVPVRIEGAVQRGDYLTAGSTPGTAVATTTAAFVVGRALEDGTGTVRMLVQPRWYPGATAEPVSVLALSPTVDMVVVIG